MADNDHATEATTPADAGRHGDGGDAGEHGDVCGEAGANAVYRAASGGTQRS